MRLRVLFFLIPLASIWQPPRMAAEAYGFGGLMKRSVEVERRLVPEVQLSNVSINVVFPNGSNGLDAQRFKSQLESDIARGGQGIFLQERDPQYEIRLFVTGFDRPHIERKTDKSGTTSTAVGDATMVMQLVHHADGQMVLSSTESYTVGGAPASAGGWASRFKLNLPVAAGASTTDDNIALQLINGLAAKVASHLVLTAESIQMPLAKGPGLDGADKLAEEKRWNEYLEALTTMTPATTPADDAYRLYDIGVANEALGYAAENPKATLKLLEEASVQYSKAFEDKGTEKYFAVCQERIEKALARYSKLEERSKQAEQLQAQDKKQAEGYAARKRAGALDNVDVIKMVRGGVDPTILLMKIQTAPVAEFDLSPDGLIQLSHSGVPAKVIVEMTQRMQAASDPTARSRAGVDSLHR